jgi:dihydrodiol dehydrogenase / D-xylose 1-dehydrogenase (NADP)
MKDKVNWGIIGCGDIAHSFARTLMTIPDASLVGVASKTPNKARKFAETFKLTKWFKNYEELLQDQKIDIIYIATTHNFHFENIMLCLNYNKHVLCEKPFTLNEKTAREAFKTAKRKKLFIMEAMWTRFLPAIQELQKKLKEEVIGDVLKVQADFWIDVPYNASNRLYNKKLAGGALLDLGIYPLTFADIVYNTPPVTITSKAVMGKTAVDEASYYLLEYKGGRVAQLSASCKAFAPHAGLIVGTKGYIEVPSFFYPQEFTINITNGKKKRIGAPYKVNGYVHEALEAMRCIREGLDESPIMPGSKTLEMLRLMDTIRKQWKLQYQGERG